MRDSPVRGMYLRPGNLVKEFRLLTMQKTVSDTGLPVSKYMPTGEILKGILAQASSDLSDRNKHLWDQTQHSLTHTIVSRGGPKAKKGDLLCLKETSYYVLTVDDVGDLAMSTIYYVEERNDIK